MMNLTRRKLIGGIGLLFAAPAIVKASSLMPVKMYKASMFIAADWGHTESYSAIFQARMITWGKQPVIEITQAPDPSKWVYSDGVPLQIQGIPIEFDE